MALSTDLISSVFGKLIAACAFLFVAIKIVAPLVSRFINERLHHEPKSNIDLDSMIDRYRHEFGGGKRSPTPAIAPKTPDHPAPSGQTHSAVALLLGQKANLENSDQVGTPAYTDTTALLLLFQNLSWGNGPEYTECAKRISNGLPVPVDAAQTVLLLSDILRESLPLPSPLTLADLHSILKTLATAHILYRESERGSGKLSESIAREKELTPSDIHRAFLFLLLREMGAVEDALIRDMAQHDLNVSDRLRTLKSDHIRKTITQMVRKKRTTQILPIHDFLLLITDTACMIDFLSPIPTSHRRDDDPRAWAYDTLGHHLGDNSESIRRSYKKLAQKKHPDRLATLHISDKYRDMAHANFVDLQSAFEIVRKDQNSN